MIDQWFWEFRKRHVQRFPRDDWPGIEDPFWDSWRAAFVRHGVDEATAEAASESLVDGPPLFPDASRSGCLEAARALLRQQQASAPSAASSRDEAERLARECDDCGGKTGLATRYRHASLRPGIPATVQFYCRCALGRWVERNHREGPEEARAVRRRIPDLLDHPGLWGPEFREPPGLERHRDYTAVSGIVARLAGVQGDRMARNGTRAPRRERTLVEPAPNVYATEPPSPEDLEAVRRRIERQVGHPLAPPSPAPSTPVPAPAASPRIEPGDADWPPF